MPASSSSVQVLEHVPQRPSGRLTGLRSTAWRAPLAAASVVAAAAHVPVTGEHLQEALYIGVLFVLLEIACVVLAVAVLRSPTRAVLAAIAVVGALAVAAFVVSRTAGLPLMPDDVGEWVEPLAIVSVAAETLMVVGAVLALVAPRRPAVLRRGAGGVAGIALLAAGALAIGFAVLPTGAPAEEGHGHGGQPAVDHDMPGMEMSGTDMSGH